MSNESLSPIKRALLRIEELEAELAARAAPAHDPIAIVGMGCRLAGGANDPDAFWHLLYNGVDAITEIPPGRWNVDALYDPDPATPGKISTRYGSFVQDFDYFDAAFFGISPREVASMDPHHRMFLEVAWEALEDAGLTKTRLAGSNTGVFAAMSSQDYAWVEFHNLEQIGVYSGTGALFNTLSGRLSYLFDLRGPSMTVDTACSSSLVALHLACQSLRSGEMDIAVTGGVNLLVSPLSSVIITRLGVLAPDGRCKTFDAHADGFGRGEGCGMLILKRFSDAQRDGDHVWALVPGSATNQDGRSASLTAPNMLAQQAVIRQALSNACLEPSQVGYVEAHGTGTALGDPIEVEALAATYGQLSSGATPCAIGSVKTNLGHLEAAAGVVGLIKAVLALYHKAIPPHLHFHELNPHIGTLDGTRLTIPTSVQPWPVGTMPRYAAVSSFGWSGTNAHVLLQETPAPPAPTSAALPDNERVYLLPISARHPQALRELAQRYAAFLRSTEAPLRDIACAACQRRTHHEYRAAVVGRTLDEWAAALDAIGDAAPAVQPPRIVFVFPGQGSQWVGMGRQLLQQEPVFRDKIAQCEAAFAPYVDWSLTDVLHAADSGGIEVIQPVIFAVQVALAALWRAWGIEPDAVVGHSMGEAAAAYVAGALSLDDAARVICRRSALLRRVRGQGAMAVVELSWDEAQQAIAADADRLAAAVSNSRRSTVLSGDPAALDAVLSRLEARGVFCRRVNVDVASHSPQMDMLKADLLAALTDLAPRASEVPIYSTVSSTPIEGDRLGAAYWVRNLREPVRFADTVQHLIADGHTCFLEVSPHPVLVKAIEEGLHDCQQHAGLALPSLRREMDERSALLGTCAALYAAGHTPTWDALVPTGGRFVRLPSYPWQQQRHWKMPPDVSDTGAAARTRGTIVHPLLGARVPSPLADMQFEAQYDRMLTQHFDDHRFDGQMMFAVSSYLELARAAARSYFGPHPVSQMDHLTIHQIINVPDEGTLTVQTVVTPTDAGHATIQVWSRPGDTWQLAASGSIQPPDAAHVPTPPCTLAEARARCPQEVSAERFYQDAASLGFGLGPASQGLQRVWLGDDEALALIDLPAVVCEEVAAYDVHPALLDVFVQTLLFSAFKGGPDAIYTTAGIDCCRVVGQVHAPLCAYARVHADGRVPGELFTGGVWVYNEQGRVVVSIEGLCEKRVNAETMLRGMQQQEAERYYTIAWRPQPLPFSQPAGGRWLIFADEQGVAQQISAHLVQQGMVPLLVYHNRQHGAVTRGTVVLDPTDPAAFHAVLDTCSRDGVSVRGIVHLWSLDTPPATDLTRETLDDAQQVGCISVLHLLQAMAQMEGQEPPRLVLVTQGAQAATDDDHAEGVAQSPLWGMGRVIQNEHPELRCTLVDIDDDAASIAALAQEVTRGAEAEEVALRGGQRRVARLERAHLPQPATDNTPISADATYLVTGGLGGIGLVVAAWLVEQGARHLVLLGRRGIASEEAAQVVDALRDAGAQVHIKQVNVANGEQVQAMLDHIARELPPLRGVFHAAAVLDDGLLLHQTPSQFARVMEPKADGAWNLHRLTRGLPLDHFVLFSSGATLLGSPGQGNYVAANALLDALAHYRHRLGLPALSINWGAWAEVGLAAAQANRGERLSVRGIRSFTPAEGLAALRRLMQQDQPQVGFMDLDVVQWVESYPVAASLALPRTLVQEARAVVAPSRPQAQPRRTLADRLRSTADLAQRRAMVERALHDHTTAALGLVGITLDASLSLKALGLDSLMALDLKRRLETDLAATLPMAPFVQDTTLAGLAQVLRERVVPPPAAPDDNGRTGLYATVLPPALQSRFGRGLVHPTLLHTATPTPLLPLQAGHDGVPPLILVHGGFGDVLGYQPLVQALGTERPVYAFQAPDPTEAPGVYASLEAMAAAYCAVLHAHHPNTPYLLGGWSSGGVVAFEMACQMWGQGQQDFTLLLLDSWLPDPAAVLPTDEETDMTVAVMHLLLALDVQDVPSFARLRSGGTEEQIQVVLESLRATRPGTPAVDAAQVRGALHIYRRTVALLRGYTPTDYPGTLSYLRASEPIPSFYREYLHLARDWRAFPAAEVDVFDLPGNHDTMLREPYVRVLAACVQMVSA